MKKRSLYLAAVALTIATSSAADPYGLGNIDYGRAAANHIAQYGLSAGYLAGVDSALDSARAFLRQDLAQQSRFYSSYSPYSSYGYATYSYAPTYSPYAYVLPYYYFSWY